MGDILQEKSYKFALRIVNLSHYLNDEKRKYVISRKKLDTGINIGPLMEEGSQEDSRAVFIQKYSLANKEAFKTNFLLRLLRDFEYLGGHKPNHY